MTRPSGCSTRRRARPARPLDPRPARRTPVHAEAHHLLDLAGEYAELGLEDERLRVLDLAADAALRHPVPGSGNAQPLVHYHRAEVLDRLGRDDAADAAAPRHATSTPGAAFPGGLADALVLERALARDDADRGARPARALDSTSIGATTTPCGTSRPAAALDPGDAAVHRGLGLAGYNVAHDGAAAAAHYERALARRPTTRRCSSRSTSSPVATASPGERERRLAANLESSGSATTSRSRGQSCSRSPATGRAIAAHRRPTVQPWEGGEGEVLPRRTPPSRRSPAGDRRGEADAAVVALRAALEPPANLGEARHPLANCSDLLLALGDALDLAGRQDEARRPATAAASSAGDFTTMLSVPLLADDVLSVLAARRSATSRRAATRPAA